MGEIRENLINKYGIGEYILLVLGLFFLFSVGKEVVTRQWEDFTLPIIGIMLLFLSVGSLLVVKPMTILDFARKRIGMDTKK